MRNNLQSGRYAELCEAIRNRDEPTARRLILYNGDVNSSCKSFLNTPLHWAVIKFEDTEVIKILLDKKADIHARNYRQQTPLDIAVQLGKVDAVELFLSNGVYAKGNLESLIYIATQQKYEKIVELLVDYCATKRLSINLKKSFDVAVEKGFSKILECIIPYCKFKKSSDKLISEYTIFKKGREYGNCTNLLLQHGFTIDPDVEQNDYLVREAVENGHSGIVEVLLKPEIDVNMVNERTGLTLLHAACLNQHLKTVEILIRHQANVNLLVNQEKWFQTSIYNDKKTAKLNRKTCLFFAVDNLNVEMTKLLLDNGANLNENPNFFSIFNLAMRKKEIFEELLEHVADVNVVDENRETLLHLCASCDYFHISKEYNIQLEIAQLLLKKGANIDAQALDGDTPLFNAVRKQYAEMAKLLLEHYADAQYRNKDGDSLLHVAVCFVHDEKFLETLLKYNTNINATNNNGFTPLHSACDNGTCEAVEVLLDHNAEVNLLNKNGDTPIIIASRHHRPIVQVLLEKNAEPNVKDKKGTTPLHYSCEDSMNDWAFDVVKSFLEHNADINALNAQGRTPLFTACEVGELPVVKLLLENNADANHVDSKGITPIWFATTSRWNCGEVIELLLEHNANVYLGNRTGRPLIHLVAEENYLEVIENLAKLNVNFSSVDKNGRSALHLATEKGHPEMVERLLEHGANINIVNKDGQTAFRLAITRLNELQAEFDDFRGNYDDDLYFINSDNSSDNYSKCLAFYGKSISTYHKIIKMFKVHIIKLKCAKLKVNRQNMDIVNNEIEDSEPDSDTEDDENEDADRVNIPDLESDCESEIEQMRMEKIGNNDITFYDLLTKSIHFLNGYAKIKSIRQPLKFDIYSMKFPLYINILKSRLAEALLRRRLLIPARKYFYSNITRLPPHCVDTVFSFLNTKDLKMFIRALRPSRK